MFSSLVVLTVPKLIEIQVFTGAVLEEEVLFINSQFLKKISFHLCFFCSSPAVLLPPTENADRSSQTEEVLDTQRFNPLTRHYNTAHVLLLLH